VRRKIALKGAEVDFAIYSAFFRKKIIDASVSQLLKKKPEDRLGMPTCPAGSIRDHVYFKTIDWTLVEQRRFMPPVKPKIVSRI